MIWRAFAACVALLAAVACAGGPTYPKPPDPASSIAVSETDIDLSSYFSDAGRIGKADLYLAQFSDRVGLVGLVSSLANRMSQSANSERLANAFVPGGAFDLRARTRSVLASVGAVGASDGSRYLLSPLLAIQADKDDRVRTAFAIRVQDAESDWVGFYFYHLEYVPNISVLEESRVTDYFAGVATELDPAISTLVGVVAKDLADGYPQGVEVELTSNHFQQWEMIPFRALQIGVAAGRPVFRVDGKAAVRALPFVMGIHVFRAGQFELR